MNKEPSIVYRAWALIVFGPGDRQLSELSQRYPDPADLYLTLLQDEAERARLHPKILSAVDNITLDRAKMMFDYCAKNHISIVSVDSREYPERLRNIYAPPQLLFYIGSLAGINAKNTVGMIGTRNPSEYSRQVAQSLSSDLASNGIPIISGFAEGIDITSQLAAAHSGGRTFAVMGCGVDVDYPKPNRRYREIITNNGAIISEFFPGTSPLPKNFPQRNRILSGLSDSIIIVEAGQRSGSLNTATHAADQGKTVFAVPPMDIFDNRYIGNIELIRDGAQVVMGSRDIFDEFRIEPIAPQQKERLVLNRTEKRMPAEPKKESTQKPKTEKSSTAAKDAHDKPASPAKDTKQGEKSPSPVRIPDTGSELGNKIAAEISKYDDGITLPYLIDRLGVDPDRVLEIITDLELSGAVLYDGTKYTLPGRKG